MLIMLYNRQKGIDTNNELESLNKIYLVKIVRFFSRLNMNE